MLVKPVKYILVALTALLAVNAFGGGYYALSGAEGVPLSWLDGTPFHSYLIPGLFLTVVVGGGMTLACVAWILRRRSAPLLSMAAGLVLVAWIVAQVAMIGYVSWMQPACFVAGLIIACLSVVALRREGGTVHPVRISAV